MTKKIHYCWFGGKPLPELTLKCIESWKKYLPDFEIVEWNENNFDVNQCVFVKEAYEQKKWAYVADYTRLKVIKNQGGLYLDTDMEITSNIDEYLEKEFFVGMEDSKMPNAAVLWASEKENKTICELLEIYESAEHFNPTGDIYEQSIPRVLTKYFEKYGLDRESSKIQELDEGRVFIYPREYFYPLAFDHQDNLFTEKSCMIHHFDATWFTPVEKFKTNLKRKNMKWAVYIIDFLCAVKRNVTIKEISIFMITFIMLMMTLFAFYPGIRTYDGNNQWEQVQKGEIINNHPVISTAVMMGLSKIWNNQAVLMVFQIILFSFIMAWICKSMRLFIDDKDKNSKSKKKIVRMQFVMQIILIIIICLVPIISLYAISNWKDIIYSYAILALILMIYIGIKKNFEYRILDLGVISLLLIIIKAYRHNGIIVTVLSFIFVLFMILKNKIPKKRIIAFVVSFVFLFVSISGVGNITLKKYPEKKIEIQNKATASALDIIKFFILSSMVVKDEITDEKDVKIIEEVMSVENIKKLYNPFLINHISLNGELNSENLFKNSSEVTRILIKYFIKNPSTVIKHYMNVDGLIWCPYNLGYIYVFDNAELGGAHYTSFDVSINSKLPAVKTFMMKIFNFTRRESLFNIFYRPANAMYLSIILACVIVFITKNKKYFMLLLPMIFNILSIMPVNVAQDLRYLYTNYLTAMFLILLIVSTSVLKKYDKKHLKLKGEK